MNFRRVDAQRQVDAFQSECPSEAFTSGASVFRTVQPEQITSGPTEEEGIAMAADGPPGDSVSLQNASRRLHDAAGEREISLEGNAAQPAFTPDGGKLLYRIVREGTLEFSFYRDLGEVWVADLRSGTLRTLGARLSGA